MCFIQAGAQDFVTNLMNEDEAVGQISAVPSFRERPSQEPPQQSRQQRQRERETLSDEESGDGDGNGTESSRGTPQFSRDRHTSLGSVGSKGSTGGGTGGGASRSGGSSASRGGGGGGRISGRVSSGNRLFEPVPEGEEEEEEEGEEEDFSGDEQQELLELQQQVRDIDFRGQTSASGG